VACRKQLEPFLPIPAVVERHGRFSFDYNRPHAIGRVRAFFGNFGMHVRALAYILANGPDGLRQTTEDAVLNANYLRKKLEGVYELPYKTATMHEVVFSDRVQSRNGIRTGDIAKRLIDYGFHPYTTAFPLIVPGALMIEPTESESKEELDLFVQAMQSIAEEAANDPQVILDAPHTTRVQRRSCAGSLRRVRPQSRRRNQVPPSIWRAYWIVSEIFTLWVRVPSLATTMIVCVPGVARRFGLMVMVVVPPPVTLFGLNVAVVRAGRFCTEKLTVPE
jgi:glycine cleavage system protein P-like pyridoxal-binding family